MSKDSVGSRERRPARLGRDTVPHRAGRPPGTPLGTEGSVRGGEDGDVALVLHEAPPVRAPVAELVVAGPTTPGSRVSERVLVALTGPTGPGAVRHRPLDPRKGPRVPRPHPDSRTAECPVGRKETDTRTVTCWFPDLCPSVPRRLPRTRVCHEQSLGEGSWQKVSEGPRDRLTSLRTSFLSLGGSRGTESKVGSETLIGRKTKVRDFMDLM